MRETEEFNFAAELLSRNLPHLAEKTAFLDQNGSFTFAEVKRQADKMGGALLRLGLKPGDRIVLCMVDGIEFVTTFLGAIQVGIIPIPLNTLLAPADYAFVLGDSGAFVAVVSETQMEAFAQAKAQIGWSGTIVVPGPSQFGSDVSLADMTSNLDTAAPFKSRAGDIAFWLYSSGSTGRPKGAPHKHSSPLIAAKSFAQDTFGLTSKDIVFSAAKLFFAYGLGNTLVFPMALGATAVLYPGRVTPDVVLHLLNKHAVTVFCGVPTLFASLLGSGSAPARSSLRLCMSAGEALPKEIGARWTDQTQTEIVEGIGSTEMLHIFVANRPGAVQYGTTGTVVPSYEVKLIDEFGQEVLKEGMGELYVRGPTMTPYYWNNPEKTAATFIDGWMKTGDKFLLREDGRLCHCGRADDMLKVSGIWVSPSEVENALLSHESVEEVAVIGIPDADGLMKTKAFIVVKPGYRGGADLAETLKLFIKGRLAAFKYPRQFEFVSELPKTGTGKIRRHVLRERSEMAEPIEIS